MSLRVKKTISPLRNPRIGTMIITTDPYWVQAMEAIIHANQSIGDELVILQVATTPEGIAEIPAPELVDQILAYKLDSLITTFMSDPVAEALTSAGLPIICLSEWENTYDNFVAIRSLAEGGKIAGRFLGEKLGGKGNVLCVSGGLEKSFQNGQLRFEGFKEGLETYPDIQIDHIPSFWSYYRAYPSLLAAFKNLSYPIHGIFGVSDTLILAARDAGKKLGIIDEKTVLIGLNGDPMALAALEEGSLSATIDTASEELGATAAYLAHQAAVGLPLPRLINQTFQLITRENLASVATRKLTAIAGIPSQMVGYSRQLEQDRVSQLEASLEITRQIGALKDREKVLEVLGALLIQHFGYEWMQIFRWSEKENKLALYGGYPSPASLRIGAEKDQLLSQSFKTGEIIFLPDIETSRRWQFGEEWEGVRSRVLLPILLGSEVMGILDLQSSKPAQPSPELFGLKFLAGQLATVLKNVDLYLEAVQARENAEKANMLKNRLIANVGHEMRTPLNSILGFSQAVQKQLAEVRELKENPAVLINEFERDIQHIYRSGEHLMVMINDLLDLSRAEIGALSLYFEQLEPSQFLRDVFSCNASKETTDGSIRWILAIPNELPMIRADIVRLRQILTNLLVNAKKYTHHGSITLGAEVDLPYLHIWVSDTGLGVPTELQESIFEPFGKILQKRRIEGRRPDGIGLGLSITRHLVLLHGGIITLESNPDRGSIFHVYLPLPGLANEPLPAVKTDGEKFLLIVSSLKTVPENIQQVCRKLRLSPYQIFKRQDMVDALTKGKPAAVAWDLVNASSREWEIVQQLGTEKDCAALPVILFGGEEKQEIGTTGLTNVFIKPSSSNLLNEWISQYEPGPNSDQSILIIDDDPQARQYYADLVRKSWPRHKILEVENGKQAINLLAHETPSLILLDLVMPELDGFEVLSWIRTEKHTRSIPVILISGRYLDYADIQRLNYARTVILTKDLLSREETLDFLEDDGIWNNQQPTSQLVKKALAYMHQNYSRTIHRKQIADELGVSENYLSQIFRQETLLTPFDYLNRFRIYKAKELLTQTNERVTQIGLKVGFNDPAYFCRVFHKFTGYSPQEFRQLGK